jgi:hypothetical protein
MKDKILKARIKPDYRHQRMVLLGGITFSKEGWTSIPPEKEAEARKAHSDILEFKDSSALAEIAYVLPPEVDEPAVEEKPEVQEELDPAEDLIMEEEEEVKPLPDDAPPSSEEAPRRKTRRSTRRPRKDTLE